MAQERFLDYEAPESTALLNGKWLEAEGEYVARGLDVTTSVDGPWKIDISPGAAVVDGVAIVEDEELQGEVTLTASDPDYPRYDIIVLQYEYEQLQSGGSPPTGEFTPRKGLAAEDPTPPEPGANEIKIADVYIPANSTELHDSNVSNTAKWAKGVSEVYTQGEIADKQFSEDGMKQALLNYEGLFTYGELTDRPEPWRYPGMVYLATDVGVAFYSDGQGWNYKNSRWTKGTEAERPPAEEPMQFHVRLNADKTKVLGFDWSDGEEWHQGSLGEGDYADKPHGNEDHDPNFLSAEGEHDNANHKTDYASASHDNASHSEDYLTEVTSTEVYSADQMGAITAINHMAAPMDVDSDYKIDHIVVRVREAPASDVNVSVNIDGNLLETVTLPSGENRHVSTDSENTDVEAGSALDFSIDSTDEQGRDLWVAVVFKEILQ